MLMQDIKKSPSEMFIIVAISSIFTQRCRPTQYHGFCWSGSNLIWTSQALLVLPEWNLMNKSHLAFHQLFLNDLFTQKVFHQRFKCTFIKQRNTYPLSNGHIRQIYLKLWVYKMVIVKDTIELWFEHHFLSKSLTYQIAPTRVYLFISRRKSLLAQARLPRLLL